MRGAAAILAALALAACGCTGGGGGGAPALEDGTLVIEADGKQQAKLKLDKFDVFLFKNDDDEHPTEPEIYEMVGPDFAAVGHLGTDMHVGYGEKWEHLFGKKIAIEPRGGDRREPIESHVNLPGAEPAKVTGGWIQVEKKDGKYADQSFLEGKLMLETEAPGGASKILFGRFRAKCNTWG